MYTRNCPECGISISYTMNDNKKRADKLNAKCVKCSRGTRNNLRTDRERMLKSENSMKKRRANGSRPQDYVVKEIYKFKDEIIKLYVNECKTIKEIFDILNFGPLLKTKNFNIISKVLKSNGIKTQKYREERIKFKENGGIKYSGDGEISQSYLSRIKAQARSRGHQFLLSKEYIINLMHKQNYKCILSGVDIRLDSYSKDSSSTASLDRIDSSNGYIEGNVQWVHKDVNLIKWTNTDLELYYICKNVYYHKSNVYPSLDDKINIPNFYWNRVSQRAKDNNRECSITKEDGITIYHNQRGRCALSGIILKIPQDTLEYETLSFNSSLDRINSNLGYLTSNCQWVDKKLNVMKRDNTDEEFYEWCKLIYFNLRNKYETAYGG